MTEEHGIYSGVVDIARNGVDEVIRLRALNAELVEALQGMIDCCPETRGTHNPHLAMARAALAKVEASK